MFHPIKLEITCIKPQKKLEKKKHKDVMNMQ
jgi:hypothetical protein